jgi:hypothetical protein
MIEFNILFTGWQCVARDNIIVLFFHDIPSLHGGYEQLVLEVTSNYLKIVNCSEVCFGGIYALFFN